MFIVVDVMYILAIQDEAQHHVAGRTALPASCTDKAYKPAFPGV
jgi:hypothetical protein